MSPLRFEPSLAHFDRQLATVGKPLPQAFLPDLVLKVFIGLVIQLLVVLHNVHNSPLILVCQVDICHVPTSSPPYLSSFQPLPPVLSVLFPPSWLPLSVSGPLASSSVYQNFIPLLKLCRCVCRDFYLPHSSFPFRTHLSL